MKDATSEFGMFLECKRKDDACVRKRTNFATASFRTADVEAVGAETKMGSNKMIRMACEK